MRIAYFLNTYPVTSATFIRGEIRELEALGAEVVRYAARRSVDPLVTETDRLEQARTTYLLDRRGALALGFLREALTNPRGVLRALGTWVSLVRNAGGDLARHAAYLLEAAALKQMTHAAGADWTHAHYSTNTAAVALLARRMGGTPYSFTAHGPNEFYDPVASSLALKVEHADLVIAISQFSRGQITLTAGMEAWKKIRIVRCGVDLDDFREDGLPEPDAPIVCVGRLCTEKAQALLPAAAARVAARRPELKMVLIGDGDARPQVEAAVARFGVERQVELLGWRSHAEVREHIAGARALLLPSFAEGLPIVLMEALALGRPVITTYVAGIPELVDARCGWIIPAGDEAALAEALEAALMASPEALAELGRVGRKRVERLHDVRTNAARLLETISAASARVGPERRLARRASTGDGDHDAVAGN